jgi:predicted enzyme related to lactoylglutathione lyase
MPRVIHFEIPGDSPERAAGFYEKVFGWTFQKWNGPMEYWLVSTGPKEMPGIDGGLLRRQPGQATTNTVQVENLDQSMAAVLANGGKLAMPKMQLPGVGWLDYCSDTEGNLFGMLEPPKSA